MLKMNKNIFLLLIILPLSIKSFAQPLIQDFNVIAPNRNFRIEAGGMLTIKWINCSYSARNISKLNIYIVKNNKIAYTIAENIPNNGKYIAKLPSDFAPGCYKIEVISAGKTSCAFSKEFYVIAKIPIKIIEPNSGSIWKQGNKYMIRWDAKGDKVYIYLLKVTEGNKFVSRLRIADAVDNNGEYTWHIPSNLEDGTYIIAIRVFPIRDVKYSPPFVIKKR